MSMVTMARTGYSLADMIDSFKRVGIETGDTVFVHVCLERLGQPQDYLTSAQTSEFLMNALQEVVGPNGTILVPTYTFSFCEQQPFDVQNTPTAGGDWSTSVDFLEYFRNLPGVIRSRDPIHSVAGLGPRASELLTRLPNSCFGEDSVHARLRNLNGKICLIGVGLDESSFRHHVEEIAAIPGRYKKLFTGYIRDKGVSEKVGWVYNVRVLADNCYPDGKKLEELARQTGKCRVARLGSGEILGISARDYFDLTFEQLAQDKWFTVKGPTANPVQLEEARVGRRRFGVQLPQNASMAQMLEALWWLPRDIISDGYDEALEALAGQLPMSIHEYPSGTECWSWIVPEKWTCREAYLETIDGRRLFSYADNPLHVVSYSLPYTGDVSREELFRHLHVHPKIADAIPFIFKYYERDWGLCCSKTLKDSLTDSHYRVVIKSDFSYGALKIGEVVAQGDSDECVVICSHLCHPAMVNDDLSGVLVGMEVMREILKRRNLRYTYRYLILPETIGGVAYLSHNENLIPRMKGGLFLEMLGLENPHALQLSFAANTEIDQCFTLAMKHHDYHGWTSGFRTIIGNDERQFNGPGVRVPMLSLSRVLPPSSPDWPYREYHSSYDSPELLSMKRLEASRDLVLKMIDALEANVVPKNNFKGEVFCSRYGLHVDAYANPEGNKALFDILDRVDGTRTIADIATECGVSFGAVKDSLDQFERFGLVDYQS
jgi:aminopeptidase-like protein/aminoglycoside N3'-acetyltransferase